MAKLGIKDKNYFPNQYINPMLISGREPNREDAPYRIFDKTNPEHPDYDKDDDEGDVQLELPLAKKKNQNMKIANLADGTPDASIMNYPTEKGFFLDGQGKAYMQTGGKFYDAGEYDVDLHGLPVPLAQQMQINPKVANITPKDFSPPPFRYMNHIRTPEIKKQEMKHMKNFIEAMGGDTKGLVKKNKSMKVYG
jgi:hypothetical protein